MFFLYAFLFWGLVFVVRTIPFLWSRSYGVDNWYWKLYFEEYRRTRRFPVKLPYYLLEYEEQWYPPLFPWLVGKIPQRIEERFGWLISPFVEGLTGSMIGLYVYALLGPLPSLGAVLIYALTPILENYNVQLNPRVFGNLFYGGMVLLLLNFESFSWGVLLGSSFLLALIALLHKMTLQISLFALLCLVYPLGWEVPLLTFLLGIGMAFLLSKGFYWKVLRAHWDILTFWNRNWRWLNGHQYFDSPLYRHLRPEGYEEQRLHRKGFAGFFYHVKLLVGMLPVALFLFLAGGVFLLSQGEVLSNISNYHFVFFWFCVIELFALLTTFVSFFKCLGPGSYYQFNAAIPVSLLVPFFMSQGLFFTRIVLMAGIIIHVGVFLWMLKRLHKKAFSGEGAVHGDLIKVLSFLKRLNPGNVWCIPLTICDAAAYFSRQKVFWGGHGMGFTMLEPFFPILRVPLDSIFYTSGKTYILADRRYFPGFHEQYGDFFFEIIYEQGYYVLWGVKKHEIDDF